MGGEITWVCDNQGRYIFTTKIYRDCNGANLTPSFSLRLHNYPTPGLSNTTIPISRTGFTDISATCGSKPCAGLTPASPDIPGAIEEHIYQSAPIRLNGVPGPLGWTITFVGFNRNNAIDNLVSPSSQALTLRAKMFAFNGQNASTCYDNSPDFAEVPSSILCTGDPFTYNHNAQDEELDSLVYSWAQPLGNFSGLYVEGSNPSPLSFVNGYSFTSPFPGTFQNPNNSPASLNTSNGEISYTSFTDGEFVSCIRVEAYRCGQKIAEIYRDIQTVLLSNAICSPNDPPFIRAPFESSPGVFNVYRDTVKAGDLVTFNLQVQDFPSATNPNADSVRVFASGLQFGANFSNPNAGCLNPPCATLSTPLPGTGFLAYQSVFNWQTSCNHISFNDGCVSLNNTYNFVIRSTDNACPAPGQTVTTISITVLADDVIESPDIYCLDVNPNGDVDLTWNQPIDTSNSFNAWLIYSGNNPNGPFTLIDSIFNYNTLSYTHVGAGANLGQRYYYVRSRSGCNDAVINVAKDTLSTIFVNATLDAANSCADLNWNPFNSLGSSGNYRIFKDGTQVSTTNATTTNLCNPITNCADTITYRVVRDNNQNACSSSSNTFEFIYKAPDPIADFSFTAACVVDPVVFTDLSTVTAGTIIDWSWDFGDGSGTSTLQNPSYTYSNPGTYTVELTVTTNLNCQATITKSVTLNPGPPADAGTNQSICVGQSTTIGGTPTTTTGNTVTWSPAVGLSSTTAFNPTANPTVTTTYTVTVTDGTACSSTDQVTVTVSPIPAADAGSNQAICLGESIAIGGSPTGPPTSTYAWSPTAGLSSPTVSNPNASPTITTTYTVTVTTGPNCTATDQVTVTVNPLPTADAGSDQTVCAGTTVTLGGSPTTGTGNTVLWSPATGLSSATALNPTVTPTATTTYTVTTTNSFNCTQTDQVTITVNPNATTDAGPDRTICIGGSVGIGSPSITGSTYSWSPALGLSSTTVSNPTASPNTTTTYTVSVVDANGCTGTDQVVVNVNPSAAADAGPDVIICVGVGQAIGGSPTGNAGSTYLWSPSAGLSSTTVANPIANPSSATTYTVLVTDANGCTGTDQVLVSIGSVPSVDAGSDQAICSGGSVSIGGSPTGAATSTFLWSPATGLSNTTAANPTASPIVTTTYSVVVTDASGCTATDQMIVTVNPSPTVSAGPDRAVCIGGSIAIGGSPTGPTGSTFAWSPSASLTGASTANPVATPTVTTTYTVTVTDGNGCTNTDDVVVTVNNLPTADAGVDQTICNGSGVAIGGSPTGPVGATYQWSPATGLSSATASNPIASPTITTQYTVTVTSGVGCTSTDVVNVTVNQNPIVDAGPDQTICNGFSATIGGSPTGAAGVTFAWTPSATLSSATASNPVANPTVTTTYTVVITDANGCTASDQMDVIVNQSPSVDAGPDLAVCNGGSLTIGGSPTGPTGSTYSWTPTASLNDPTLSNPIATPTATTTYTVLVTDANGCTNTDDVIVSINALPTADAGRDTAICLGETTTIGGNPTGPAGSTFAWSPTTGLSSSTASNPVANPIVTTTYTVTITDGNGCTATDDVVVTINPLPVVDAGADVFVCINDTIQIGGAPTGPLGSTYAWTPSASIVDATAENPRVFPLVTTTYTVVVTDINGCTNTDDVLVSVNPLPTIEAGDSAYVCPGFSEQLQANGGVSYVWDADPTLSSLTISNPVASPLISTTYFVTGTDANGCSNRDSVFVLVAPDVPTDAGLDQSICLNDSVRLGGNSSSPLNTIYSWSPTTGLSDPTIANPMASPSVTTKYFLSTTNDTCSGVDSVTITVNPVITADFSATTICQNDSTSFTDLSGVVSGNITNWLWDFGDGSVNSTIQNPKHLYLTSGTFNVKLVVTSDAGCLDSITKAVVVNPNPNSDAGNDQTICFGDTTLIGGSPTGDPANVFSWSPALGLDNPSIANPRAFPQTTTKYFVTVTDANGCTGLDSMEVIVNPLPLIDAGTDITICEQASAQLQATGAVTYTWSPIATLSDPTISNPIATPTDTTQYFVIGTDANGCQNIDSITVFVSPRPVALFEADTVCEGNPTTFTDLSTVSSGSITGWIWDFGDGVGTSTQQNPVYTYGSDGEFTVQLIATSGLSCSDTFNLQVKVDSLPLIDAGSDITYCIGDTAQIQATGAVSYAWTPTTGLSDPAIANPQVFVTTTTTYTVTGIGANGCFTTDDILVTVNPLPVIDAGNDLEICLGDTVVIGGSPSGPATASYQWTPTTGLDFDTVQNPLASPQVTTKYFLEVTDGNSCVSIDSMEIVVNPLPVIDAGPDTAICKNSPLQLNATGASTYLWTPTRGLSDPFIANPIATLDTTTTYVITGTDTNGCISTDTLLIEVLDVDFASDIELCEGESVMLNPQLSGDTAGITYLWTPSRTITSTTVRNPVVSPLATTKYFLTVTNAAGCVAVDSVTIRVNVTPIPEFNIDFTASCSGLESRVQNFTVNGIVHLWNVNGSDDTLIAFEPDLGLRYNTTNQVTLIAVNNTCADTLTKSIEVGEAENYLNLTQTNIFSPNGDGINDAFVLEFKGEFVNCAEIIIFNRWGDVVYTSNVERSGWDGRTQSGEKAPSGTYFYVIKLADSEIKGSVMLSR